MSENFNEKNNSNDNNQLNQGDNSYGSQFGTDDLLQKIGNEINHIHDERPSSNNNSTGSIPAIFEYLPPLIHEMFKKGIGFSIENTGEVTVKDFYRPSTIKMLMNNDETFSIEFRKENILISNLDDLINLNYREWKKTGKGKGNYDIPSKCWADLFGEKGLIKKQVVFIPTDD